MFKAKSIWLVDFEYSMKPWLFWAGVSFIIGGSISLALNLGVESALSMVEDLTGYAIGWMAVGAVFIVYSLVKGKKEKKE